MAASMRCRSGAIHCSNWVRSAPDMRRAAIRIAQRRDRVRRTKIEAECFCLPTVGHDVSSCPVRSSLSARARAFAQPPERGKQGLPGRAASTAGVAPGSGEGAGLWCLPERALPIQLNSQSSRPAGPAAVRTARIQNSQRDTGLSSGLGQSRGMSAGSLSGQRSKGVSAVRRLDQGSLVRSTLSRSAGYWRSSVMASAAGARSQRS